jgi:predicted enzyme related to lactoylglutathione lyase
VTDVDAAVAFYTEMLGFRVEMHPGPGFAIVAHGNLRLMLNRSGAGGAGQAMPDGQLPAPGGWNRFQIAVEDLATTVETMKGAGGKFRNEIVTGNGGKQILLEDPSGNPIELFESPAENAVGRSWMDWSDKIHYLRSCARSSRWSQDDFSVGWDVDHRRMAQKSVQIT